MLGNSSGKSELKPEVLTSSSCGPKALPDVNEKYEKQIKFFTAGSSQNTVEDALLESHSWQVSLVSISG